jgi:hypothetical protein
MHHRPTTLSASFMIPNCPETYCKYKQASSGIDRVYQLPCAVLSEGDRDEKVYCSPDRELNAKIVDIMPVMRTLAVRECVVEY